jgi:hypothetical protein
LLRVSRLFIVLAGLMICAMAILSSQMSEYKDLLRLAMAMAGYTYGAMLGILLLALLPWKRDARGLIWGVPFSVLIIFALNWQHHTWARSVVAVVIAGLLLMGIVKLAGERWKLIWIVAVAAMVLFTTFGKLPVDGIAQPIKLAFPWTFPLGAALTLFLGVVLGRAQPAPDESSREPVEVTA